MIMGVCWIMLAAVHVTIFLFTDSGLFQRVECVLCFVMSVLCMVDAFWYLRG